MQEEQLTLRELLRKKDSVIEALEADLEAANESVAGHSAKFQTLESEIARVTAENEELSKENYTVMRILQYKVL